jgi:hypothetical protein
MNRCGEIVALFQPLPLVGSGDVIGKGFFYSNETDTVAHRDTFLTASTLFNSARIWDLP